MRASWTSYSGNSLEALFWAPCRLGEQAVELAVQNGGLANPNPYNFGNILGNLGALVIKRDHGLRRIEDQTRLKRMRLVSHPAQGALVSPSMASVWHQAVQTFGNTEDSQTTQTQGMAKGHPGLGPELMWGGFGTDLAFGLGFGVGVRTRLSLAAEAMLKVLVTMRQSRLRVFRAVT